MRRSILLMMFVLVLFACDTHTGPDEGISFFEHPNFGGSSHTTQVDVFDFDDINGPCNQTTTDVGTFGGDFDNCISSIQVTPGWEVTLYEHDEYEGETLTIAESIRDLDDVSGPCGNDWDDCVSSVRVRRSP